MKLAFFFSQGGPDDQPPKRRDPAFAGGGRAAPFDSPDGHWPLALPGPTQGRLMSPRQLAEWAHEMYVQGSLSWEEYRCAACHPELAADYNSTVGALTGATADPERPRDMVREWEERLAFLLRHNPSDGGRIRRIEKVLAMLQTSGPGGSAR